MLPTSTECYRALTARDPRFDGVFFTGVTSTGIFCRPVCPARTPREDRCRFFAHAAEASQAGFRPCLRCRPELAPGLSPLEASPRLVQRAMARIEQGVLEEESLEGLADALGTSSRHLRRAFLKELGVTPVEYAQTQRLLSAKRLLTETALPVSEVAFASGFRSIRRFNASFKERLRLDPTGLRRRAPGRERLEDDPRLPLELVLAFRPPLAWDELLGFLAARAIPGVEWVSEGRYLRTVRLGEVSGVIQVGPPRERTLPVSMSHALWPVVVPLLAKVRALFDLDARPDAIAQVLADDPHLGWRLGQAPGIRVPGAFDGFELAVRAILGQQVSVKGATTLAGRLVEAFGAPVQSAHPVLTRSFPPPRAIAQANPKELSKLGILPARAQTLVSLAREIDQGRLVLRPGVDAHATLAQLESLPGVGPWTSHYIGLRALRWLDAFPHGDLWLRRAIAPSARPGDAPSSRELLQASEAWRPFRAVAALLLWTFPNREETT
ncbi:MAG: DNA-3-methyladenine glycosylase 2 family protein [Deltaproteobacteria bacterium]|nr:DNA-3-methyladenine glycosylase 2 family protein [Deltaproteobacteria bacterium]